MVKSQNILKSLHIIDQLIVENCFCWYLSFLFSIFFSHTKTKQKKKYCGQEPYYFYIYHLLVFEEKRRRKVKLLYII